MSETATQLKEQRLANLAILHRQLEEMATRTKPVCNERQHEMQEPVLVIRGK